MNSIRANPTSSSPFAAYAAAMSRRNFYGRLLKYAKGEYIISPENILLPPGTRVVAIMKTLRVGWQCWKDGHPIDNRMGVLAEGFRLPNRSDLGDADESKWERDSNGIPRDPWQPANMLVLITPKSDDVFTFTTNSLGGVRAVADLCDVYDQAVGQNPGCYPLVSLESGSYQHSNRALGRIKFPLFKVVELVVADRFDAMLAVVRGEPEGRSARSTFGATAASIALAKPKSAEVAIDDDTPF
jgi:hypothetical protein